MATDLKTLKADIEIPNTSEYIKTEVNLSSFYGGAKRGHSLQIGFNDEESNYKFVQLSNSSVRELVNTYV